MPRRPLHPWHSMEIQATKKHRMYCERLWIMTNWHVPCDISRSVKLKLKIPWHLPNQNATIKRFKPSRVIKGHFFSVASKVLHENQTNITNSDKHMPYWFNIRQFSQMAFPSSILWQSSPLVEESYHVQGGYIWASCEIWCQTVADKVI